MDVIAAVFLYVGVCVYMWLVQLFFFVLFFVCVCVCVVYLMHV